MRDKSMYVYILTLFQTWKENPPDNSFSHLLSHISFFPGEIKKKKKKIVQKGN